MDKVRALAADILLEFERRNTYPNLALNTRLKQISNLRDKKFITALVYGVIEKRLFLDFYISRVSSVKLKKIDIVILTILRMGLYQQLFMKVPPSAACNTSVNLAKDFNKSVSAGFVNAVLRRLGREYESISIPEDDTAQYLSITYSVSKPIVNKLIDIFGKDECESFLKASSGPVCGCYIAVNILKTTPGKLFDMLNQKGVYVKKTAYDNLLYVEGLGSVEQNELYRSGYFHIISYPSFIAAHMFQPKPNAVIMDMCSAPGGKTFVIAENMPSADIYAFDIHPHKINIIKNQARRLGIKNIKTKAINAASYDNANLYQKADYILCDVPCSGLGMIKEKPDIKYKMVDFEALTALQLQILNNASKYLKTGGKLIYSTCTINPDENDRLICKFLKKSNQFRIDETAQIVDNIVGEMSFLPHKDFTDGFYIAALTKRPIE